ncbi:MAG: S9 family peptidase [Xanthomonadales bacterium]|nr:S9 family peptidase [Xanthomonadales bacterium]
MLPATLALAVEPHSLDDFLRLDKAQSLKISPDGTHYAIVVPFEDRSILNIVNRADGQTTGYVNPGAKVFIVDFMWATNDRILFSVGQKFGRLDTAYSTGEILATDADGGNQQLLFGFRGEGERAHSRINRGKKERASGFLLDRLPSNPDKVLIRVVPWTDRTEPYARVDEMDIRSGQRKEVAQAPVPNAYYVTDQQGVVRLAIGSEADNRRQTFYRDSADADWELLNNEAQSNTIMVPLGFSEDGATAYLQVEDTKGGADTIYAFDVASKEQTAVLTSDYADPVQILRSMSGRAVIGATYMEGKPVMRFFDKSSPDAIVFRSMAASFKGSRVAINSATADGNEVIVSVSSDRSPGDYYLFNREAKSADLVFSRANWIDPQRTGEVRPVQLEARDGLALHGYLTLPPGVAEPDKLPMVVYPHGGPFGEQDEWRYDGDTQLLAAQGYAVLQINFRGSGGYGRRHRNLGAQEWGKSMQDDLTDATRWAIEQGYADAGRICIYGASYGAYASLMGVAKEPDLYRCAAGYVGIYDLEMMHKRGDIQTSRSGRSYLDEAVGSEGLAAVSPVNLAGQIKAPVFLAAGGEDQRAPVEHTEAMEKALKKAGVPVQSLIYGDEGHGFFDPAHEREYYTQLLAFFDRHIGSKAAATDAP